MFLLTGTPLPPSIKISFTATETVKVCFSTYSYYPIRYFEFNVTDGMRDELVKLSKADECAELSDSLLPQVCSPYNVSVKAYNKVGESNTSWISKDIREGDISIA